MPQHFQLPLSDGKYALVDTEDMLLVLRYRWHVSEKADGSYAQTNVPHPFRKGQTRMKLHRLIMGLVFGDERIIDHINGDRLDDRRCNLRIVTMRENCQNRRQHRENGKVLGATLHGRPNLTKPWVSHARIDGRLKNLGYYYTEAEAGAAYTEAVNALR